MNETTSLPTSTMVTSNSPQRLYAENEIASARCALAANFRYDIVRTAWRHAETSRNVLSCNYFGISNLEFLICLEIRN